MASTKLNLDAIFLNRQDFGLKPLEHMQAFSVSFIGSTFNVALGLYSRSFFGVESKSANFLQLSRILIL